MSVQRTPKILVVDDSRTDLALMANVLRRAGYTVVLAADGDEALAKALAERPDCVVLDVVLPKQSGFQVCRRLRQMPQTRAIPIILVSVKNTTLDRQWGLH